ncbi:sulfate ABC transporter permease subunit CysT (plasmid) [Sinorhizobium meliloti WSM1022]|jgi:sulfate transport system permease protein|uniref:Sulfate transport system permease protein CysT n=3 Tax=Sinorhizobium TaxID=28105 RepID=Q92VJ0_RHIME|nr:MULTISPECIES: sulfate ABC transporter permease subunit CysT [Sinorhizobium]TWB02938.1 sulfate transport system permease protein [Ensifer sp. SEMIA 134]TWB29486.1 sulfate transport system permease protein [Ensifer sp. SEMIA 135]AEG08256.1 sulfate ABC transporter, inner membrane subunit CysT [Sinorhizobium meliloti BL225C]AGA10976.1 sulfate ABC transporter, permease protein CysT [Sinorhizobium meliloti GR4]AGG71725.1 Putative sulfate uptake ABC transporter,permease component [Sinorhizobium me
MISMAARSSTRWRFRQPSVIPGFGLALGVTLAWLTIIVLIPLSGLLWRSSGLGWSKFVELALDERTVNALTISFGTAFIAAVVNLVFGVLLAWVLVRYRFPGKRVIDAMVDLPFALPTAVAGIALTTLYAPNGWIGSLLAPLGIKIAFTPAGIVVALIFVGLPFVVRTVQPIMEEIDKEVEEAAATLGATRFQTISRVLLPGLLPAGLTGFALAFARGVGEYGSVIFIAGNLPYVSEIAPLLIVIRLEEFNYPAATAIAAVMLLLSFMMLLVINVIQAWSRRRYGYGA